jgi:hypothetical protein
LIGRSICLCAAPQEKPRRGAIFVVLRTEKNLFLFFGGAALESASTVVKHKHHENLNGDLPVLAAPRKNKTLVGGAGFSTTMAPLTGFGL